MKRALLTTLSILLLLTAIAGIRELTQNRPDPELEGSSTIVEFRIREHRFQRGETAAAAALWTVCSSTVSGDVSAVPEQTADADVWLVSVAPAIGEHGENRLQGCLEDVTVDRVVGDVVGLRRSE